VRYRVWVHSRDRRRWEAKEKWRRRGMRRWVAVSGNKWLDALWELSGKYDVGAVV
jgi:hypothetical protein